MFAIAGARVHTAGEAGSLDNATILVKDGKILDVGPDLTIPGDFGVYDASGLEIAPGFIDAHSHVGIETRSLSIPDACDLNTPLNPQLMALDAFNPREEGLGRCLRGGITTIGFLPGGLVSIGKIPESIGVVAGLGSVVKTRTHNGLPVVLRERACMKMAVGEHPKQTMRERKKPPFTRMGVMSLLREALEGGRAETPEWRNRNTAALLRREFPARVHVHRVGDIRSVLTLADEYGFDVVLDHVTEGYMLPELLKDKGVPCVIGPITMTKMGPELRNSRVDNAIVLSQAGVKVAITCDHPSFPGWHLPLHAGILVREGMDYQQALRAVTLAPAEILGVQDRVGSIEQGKDADLVLFRGDPLEYASPIQAVVCDGRLVTGSLATGAPVTRVGRVCQC